ncbi:MAG TPA: TraB/GumN family protein [Steroidobacteraceae bacterium]|nr:TraB/GumN family protein [Steroidobacteraceae bacterium]
MNAAARRHRSAGSIALCAAAGLLGIGAPADARDRHTLWTVDGEQNTVYLLGSIHVLRAGDDGLPRVAEDAYEDAEQLVMEIDLDDAFAGDAAALLGAMQRMALLPEEESLREVLGADYDTINARAREAGLDLALLDRFAPWFVAVTLLQLELAKRGFSPELGVEQGLAARAVADGKPILGLETAEQQFAVLAGLPMPMQKQFLVMTLEDAAGLDAQIDELMRAWRDGDSDALARLLSEEFDEFPELYKPLTEDRNRAWLGQIVDLLDDRDDYLVVVGALHLVGRNSVVDLLRQRGYEVTQQ